MAFTLSGVSGITGLNLTTTQPGGPQPYLWSWGNNGSGSLGLGNLTYYSSPKQVGSLGTWTKVFAGYGKSFAIKNDGTMWAWGDNGGGELGLSDASNRSSPVQVGALTTWAMVAHGGSHAVAIKTDGTLWTWGGNYYKQLGQGDTIARSSPVQVGADTNWSACAAGGQHCIAVKTNGTLWTWGGNSAYGYGGALGFGTVGTKADPTQVGSGTTWSKICAHDGASFAIKTDNTLWSWGRNSYGQLGLGSTTHTSSPQQVGSSSWSTLPSGRAFFQMYAIQTGGTLWSWGKNYAGRLGLGDTTTRSNPTQIGALTTWLKLALGDGAGAAIKTDGTLWVWGGNYSGMLGQGDTTHKSSPVQVGNLNEWANVAMGGGMTLAIGTQ